MDVRTFVEEISAKGKLAGWKISKDDIMEAYYAINQNNIAEPKEMFFHDVEIEILRTLIKVEDLGNGMVVLYQQVPYQTAAQKAKLAGMLHEVYGLDTAAVLRTLNSLTGKTAVPQNAIYDKSAIIEALDNIMSHEQLTVDIVTGEYKRIVGHTKDGNEITSTITPDVLRTIITANEDARALNTETKPMTKELMNYMQYYTNDLKDKLLIDIVGKITYDEKYEGVADKYLTKLHKVFNCIEDLDVFIMLMKHMVWQIKRRATERSLHNDIMITLRGAQGIGKSYLVDALFGSVLGKFFAPSAKLDDLMDERWTPALGNLLLANIDETDTGKVGKMGGKAMASIKRIITCDTVTYRPMGTNTTVDIKKKVTFLSTSNFHIYEIMEDESGMRRFFEFNSKNENQQRFDYDEVKKLKDSALVLFKSIDENKAHGYWDIESETGKKITHIQSTYVNKSNLQEFIDDNLVFVEDLAWDKCLTLDQVYNEYSNFMALQNINEKHWIVKKNFRRKLEDSFYGCTKTRSNVNKFKFDLKKTHKMEYRNPSMDDGNIYSALEGK